MRAMKRGHFGYTSVVLCKYDSCICVVGPEEKKHQTSGINTDRFLN